MIKKSNTNFLHLQVLLQNSPFPTGIFRVQVRHVSYTTNIDSLPTKEKIKIKMTNKILKNYSLQKTSNLCFPTHSSKVKS